LAPRSDIEGAPFIQQDARVGACAQAAIWWPAARFMNAPALWLACRQRYHAPRYHADRFELSGALPHGSKGLSPIHIVRALRGIGHQPYCATFVDDGAGIDGAAEDEASDAGEPAVLVPDAAAEALPTSLHDTAVPTIVRYLDSGLPVILGLANIADDRRDGHA